MDKMPYSPAETSRSPTQKSPTEKSASLSPSKNKRKNTDIFDLPTLEDTRKKIKKFSRTDDNDNNGDSGDENEENEEVIVSSDE